MGWKDGGKRIFLFILYLFARLEPEQFFHEGSVHVYNHVDMKRGNRPKKRSFLKALRVRTGNQKPKMVFLVE